MLQGAYTDLFNPLVPEANVFGKNVNVFSQKWKIFGKKPPKKYLQTRLGFYWLDGRFWHYCG